MKPYTYLIGWPEHNTWYYGVRYATGCNPSDLWNPYTTSSKHVDAFVAEHGVPSVREIRRTFKNTIQARVWEERVLKRMKVVGNNRWLNKTDNKSIAPLYGKDHPHYGKTGDAHHSYGKLNNRASEAQKRRWANSDNKNPMKDPEVVARKVAKTSGANHHMKRPEVAEKVSGINHYSKKPGYIQPKLTCQYCNNSYKPSNLIRHETACKSNLTSSVGNTDKTVYNNLVGSI